MEKKIKISFNELAKSVSANVEIEVTSESVINNEEVLKETKDLFEQAHAFAKLKTINKQV